MNVWEKFVYLKLVLFSLCQKLPIKSEVIYGGSHDRAFSKVR